MQLLRCCSVHSVVYTSQDCCTNSHWWPITQSPAGFTSQSNTQVWGKWAQQAFNLWVWKNPDSEGNLGVELWAPLVRQFEAQPEASEGSIDQKVCSNSPQNNLPWGNTVLLFCIDGSWGMKYNWDQGPRTSKIGMQFVLRPCALNHCCAWPCEHVLYIGMQFGMDTAWNNLVTPIKINTN